MRERQNVGVGCKAGGVVDDGWWECRGEENSLNVLWEKAVMISICSLYVFLD